MKVNKRTIIKILDYFYNQKPTKTNDDPRRKGGV